MSQFVCVFKADLYLPKNDPSIVDTTTRGQFDPHNGTIPRQGFMNVFCVAALRHSVYLDLGLTLHTVPIARVRHWRSRRRSFAAFVGLRSAASATRRGHGMSER